MNAEQKQQNAKNIVKILANEFNATLTEWESSDALSLWDYADFLINEQTIKIGCSGGGVISINRLSFYQCRDIIDNYETAKKVIAEII